jgi:type I restriction enzyme S subunit
MKRIAIADVCLINPRLSRDIASQKDRIVDFVPMTNLGENGRLTLNETRRLGEVLKGYTYFENGDVLVAKITPCMENGKAAYVDSLTHGIAFGSTEFHVLRPNNNVYPRYLFHMVWTPYFRNEASRNMTGTAGQQRVPSTFFERFEIPLPPLPEQKRIADILDKAESIRRKRQEVSSSLENFPLALFKHLFGHPDANPSKWQMLPFSKVCESRLGKMLDAKQQSGKHNRPYMRNLNVQWGRLDLSQIYEMDFDKSDRAEFRLKHGDVLVCEGGAGVGQTAIWRDELPECYFQKSLHRVRPLEDKATPEYIAYLMWTLMKGSSLLRSISSATIPHLTGEKLKDILIPVPPLQLQQHFSNQCQTIARLSSKAAENLKITDDLFNSLVQQAFRGAL